jgi:hypothetical protein
MTDVLVIVLGVVLLAFVVEIAAVIGWARRRWP